MKQSNNQSKELGCEYCSGENDKPGWKGGFSDDGYIGYTQCFSCNEDGQRDEAMNSTKGDNTPTNTLEDYTHYRRTCQNCGENWWGLHCPHDGYQNPCPQCKKKPEQVRCLYNECDCEFVIEVPEAERMLSQTVNKARIDELNKILAMPLSPSKHKYAADRIKELETPNQVEETPKATLASTLYGIEKRYLAYDKPETPKERKKRLSNES